MKKLTITYTEAADGTTTLDMVAAQFGAAADGAPVTRVAFTLTPDAVTAVPKRREKETDEAYTARVATINPDKVQVDPGCFAGVADHCKAVLESVADPLAHYQTRAAMVHALAADGKAAPGVKQVKVGGSLGVKGAAAQKKH